MANKKSTLIPGLSFSWKRAIGITKAKQEIAKKYAEEEEKRKKRIQEAEEEVICLIPTIHQLEIDEQWAKNTLSSVQQKLSEQKIYFEESEVKELIKDTVSYQIYNVKDVVTSGTQNFYY